MERILIVEDADSLREVLSTVLESSGFAVDSVATAEEGIELAKRNGYACILSDFKLPKKNGIELLRETRQLSQLVPFIIMTAFGSIDIAIEAMKEGANDFVCKPFEPDTICRVIREVIQHRRIIDRETGLRTKRNRIFVTESTSVKKLLLDAKKVARVDTSVLILGESGTGKELVARYIHEHSPRAEKPFVAVNCAAMPPDLLESEFFGHEAGAFTGATQSRVGVFEYASEGTIFLDEVGDMPLPLQVKLLRALQEHEIKRVGSNRVTKVNPRVIAATNQNVEESIKSGSLREDFYYRLAVMTLMIPPLRERREDISLLIEYYIKSFCDEANRPLPVLSAEARRLLLSHSWPGNARELENVIERAVILAEDQILPDHLGLSVDPTISALQELTCTLPEIATLAARKAEIELITRVLSQTSGNKSRAAELLGVSYKTLLNKVKEYNIEQPR